MRQGGREREGAQTRVRARAERDSEGTREGRGRGERGQQRNTKWPGGRGMGMRVRGGAYKSIPLKVSLLLIAFIPTQCRKEREARGREGDKEENGRAADENRTVELVDSTIGK